MLEETNISESTIQIEKLINRQSFWTFIFCNGCFIFMALTFTPLYFFSQQLKTTSDTVEDEFPEMLATIKKLGIAEKKLLDKYKIPEDQTDLKTGQVQRKAFLKLLLSSEKDYIEFIDIYKNMTIKLARWIKQSEVWHQFYADDLEQFLEKARHREQVIQQFIDKAEEIVNDIPPAPILQENISVVDNNIDLPVNNVEIPENWSCLKDKSSGQVTYKIFTNT